jgi:curli biogenesis system outer membrane secretion channel CsgG
MSAIVRLRRAGAIAGLGLLLGAPALAQSDDGLEKCSKPIGTLAVVEPKDETIRSLQRYSLESPTSLIRMMAQQSKCFVVVERGKGLQTMKGERELANSGDLEQGSNVGGGQMKAADYFLTPDVLFSEGNAGGIGGAVGGIVGRHTAGAVGGGVKFKEAETTLLLGDVRSGVQVASAQGKAKKGDLSLGGIGFFGSALAAGGGYTHTNEGKVIAKSFLDNYNKLVKQIRDDPSLVRQDATALKAATGAAHAAGAVFQEGDVVGPKIDNVKLLASPSGDAKAVATLKKTDELVFLGEEKDGYIHVQSGSAEGWIKSALVQKH